MNIALEPDTTSMPREPRARVIVRLVLADGTPAAGVTVGLTTTSGVFLCDSLTVATDSDQCDQISDTAEFATGDDGTMTALLAGMKVGIHTEVTASAMCSGYSLFAGAKVLFEKTGP
jgi:hypothetical protein